MAKTIKPKIEKELSEKDSLAKELKTLIPKLDEEGLIFLIKQAQVHLYNMQVDVLNQTIIRETNRVKISITKNVKPQNQNKTGFSDIKISGSGRFVLYNNQWISFTAGEIDSLARIAKEKESELEIRGRIYNWLSRERSDVLNTASVADKFDKQLNSLITLLKKNVKLKR